MKYFFHIEFLIPYKLRKLNKSWYQEISQLLFVFRIYLKFGGIQIPRRLQIGCTKNESCWSKKIAKKVSSKEVNDCNVDDLHFFEV